MRPPRELLAHVTGQNATRAVINRADGSTIDLGRVDGPFPWRLWIYKKFTYPRLVREQQKETSA